MRSKLYETCYGIQQHVFHEVIRDVEKELDNIEIALCNSLWFEISVKTRRGMDLVKEPARLWIRKMT